MDILDNAAAVAQRDPQNALGFAAGQPEQLKYDFNLTGHDFGTAISNVVFAGMGGSALSAEFVHIFPKLTVPYVIAKGYSVPAFVDEHSLVVCASYSGNTEETLSALEEAEKKGAKIAVIAHGGKLLEQARANNYALAELPECPQPRTATLYGYRAIVELLVAAKAVEASIITELESIVDSLEQAVAEWAATVPTSDNLAKQLAQQLVGKTPIIYGGAVTYPAAYKWKISVNENAKNTAWCNQLPEFNHNEFIGWSSHPVEKPFAVVDLISSYEHERVLKRFEVTDRLLSGMRPKAIRVEAKGSSVLEHMLYLVLLGDFATTYLALLNGVNPTPVELVEKFKKELG
jgi:glucose/mannose-6-phosphate isomerase